LFWGFSRFPSLPCRLPPPSPPLLISTLAFSASKYPSLCLFKERKTISNRMLLSLPLRVVLSLRPQHPPPPAFFFFLNLLTAVLSIRASKAQFFLPHYVVADWFPLGSSSFRFLIFFLSELKLGFQLKRMEQNRINLFVSLLFAILHFPMDFPFFSTSSSLFPLMS